MEMLLTIEQAATKLQVHPETVRRQLKRGVLRGFKRGNLWRVPESALEDTSASAPTEDTPEARAAAIRDDLRSGNSARRNAAIIRLTKSDARTVEIVTQAAARAVEKWDGPEDDLSQWRNVDLKPHFPEEAPDYLNGLYRADDTKEETA